MYASINTIVVLFIDVVIDEFKLENLIIYIFCFIALFGIFICGLIFNEIIIIRFCSMNKYTTKEIMRRQKEEMDRSNKMVVELTDTTSESDTDNASNISRAGTVNSVNSINI